eukprot:6089417-Prymnesium_polylepis.1
MDAWLGKRVRVAGLEQRHELNGREGMVDAVLTKTDRCAVTLDGATGGLQFRRANLALLESEPSEPVVAL